MFSTFEPKILCRKLAVLFILVTTSVFYGQNKTIQTSGDVLLFALPATALTGSLIAGDSEGTWQFAKGFALNQAITVGLKYATDKKRPYNNGDRAFPSGHTSTTFQSAAFIQKRYGWSYGIPAYILAGYTGYSRIEAQKHDGWDVLAGAVVGIGSAYIFTTPYQREHMQLSFASDADSYSLGFVYKF
tara:strand:- start:1114 stop:1674 length:561 start_codon:yes stop_codon:yes gene_type:complete